jgi:hypothetical protein
VEIYRSSTLEVMQTIADPAALADTGADLVTFESLARGPNRPPFGSRFAAKYGLNALHIIPAGDDWYQYPDLDDCLAAVAARTAPGATVSGASMGAFAATTYADALGAAKVIAIAPQYTIERGAAPFEKRWANQAARITFRPDHAQVAQGCHHYIFYDNKTPDGRHADLIAAAAAKATLVHVEGGGHTVAVVLAEAGCLSSLTRAIIAGEPSAEELQTLMAEHLPKSPHRHLSLGLQAPMAERETHFRAGLVLEPNNLKLRHGLARYLLATKRAAEALPHFEFVVQRRPLHPRYREDYLAACTDAGAAPRGDLLEPAERPARREPRERPAPRAGDRKR